VRQCKAAANRENFNRTNRIGWGRLISIAAQETSAFTSAFDDPARSRVSTLETTTQTIAEGYTVLEKDAS
jgi:hypothetical protein